MTLVYPQSCYFLPVTLTILGSHCSAHIMAIIEQEYNLRLLQKSFSPVVLQHRQVAGVPFPILITSLRSICHDKMYSTDGLNAPSG